MYSTFYNIILDTRFIITQIVYPITVGIMADKAAHFILPVSFFTVIIVVEQGQCIRVKTSAQTAVTPVHPFDINRDESAPILCTGTKIPPDE